MSNNSFIYIVLLVHYTSYCTFDKIIKVTVIWLHKESKILPTKCGRCQPDYLSSSLPPFQAGAAVARTFRTPRVRRSRCHRMPPSRARPRLLFAAAVARAPGFQTTLALAKKDRRKMNAERRTGGGRRGDVFSRPRMSRREGLNPGNRASRRRLSTPRGGRRSGEFIRAVFSRAAASDAVSVADDFR